MWIPGQLLRQLNRSELFGKRRKYKCLLYWWVGFWTIAIKVCFLGMWRYLYWPRQDLNKDICNNGWIIITSHYCCWRGCIIIITTISPPEGANLPWQWYVGGCSIFHQWFHYKVGLQRVCGTSFGCDDVGHGRRKDDCYLIAHHKVSISHHPPTK